MAKLEAKNIDVQAKNDEANEMMRLKYLDLEYNEHMLKMTMETKLTRARAMSVASGVTIESKRNLRIELECVKALLKASRAERILH